MGLASLAHGGDDLSGPLDQIFRRCGHQMGKCCFQEWAKESTNHVYCTLCRGKCNTMRMWEPMVPQNPLL